MSSLRERSAVEKSLEWIPRSVRDRLDRVGIKLHLREWQALSLAERRRLVEAPCETPAEASTYRALLTDLVRGRTGADPRALP